MQLEVGAVFDGKITGLTNFGAFVELPNGKTGMVHISEVANAFVKEIREYVKENQVVKVKVLSISDDGKVSLSMKKALDPPAAATAKNRRGETSRPTLEWQAPKKDDSMSFEDMMSKFKQASDEKMSDLKRASESKHGGFSRRGGHQKY